MFNIVRWYNQWREWKKTEENEKININGFFIFHTYIQSRSTIITHQTERESIEMKILCFAGKLIIFHWRLKVEIN